MSKVRHQSVESCVDELLEQEKELRKTIRNLRTEISELRKENKELRKVIHGNK